MEKHENTNVDGEKSIPITKINEEGKEAYKNVKDYNSSRIEEFEEPLLGRFKLVSEMNTISELICQIECIFAVGESKFATGILYFINDEVVPYVLTWGHLHQMFFNKSTQKYVQSVKTYIVRFWYTSAKKFLFKAGVTAFYLKNEYVKSPSAYSGYDISLLKLDISDEYISKNKLLQSRLKIWKGLAPPLKEYSSKAEAEEPHYSISFENQKPKGDISYLDVTATIFQIGFPRLDKKALGLHILGGNNVSLDQASASSDTDSKPDSGERIHYKVQEEEEKASSAGNILKIVNMNGLSAESGSPLLAKDANNKIYMTGIRASGGNDHTCATAITHNLIEWIETKAFLDDSYSTI